MGKEPAWCSKMKTQAKSKFTETKICMVHGPTEADKSLVDASVSL